MQNMLQTSAALSVSATNTPTPKTCILTDVHLSLYGIWHCHSAKQGLCTNGRKEAAYQGMKRRILFCKGCKLEIGPIKAAHPVPPRPSHFKIQKPCLTSFEADHRHHEADKQSRQEMELLVESTTATFSIYVSCPVLGWDWINMGQL